MKIAYRLTGLYAAALLLTAGAAVAAETRIRVTNSAVNPVTYSIGKQSKDIRPRKTMTFTTDSNTPTYSLFFHNGVMDRGLLHLSEGASVTDAEGVETRCLTLTDEGFDFDTAEDCQKKIDKAKK